MAKKNNIIFVILLIALVFFLTQGLTLVPIDFAGATWYDSGTLKTSSFTGGGGVSGSLSRDGESVIIEVFGSEAIAERYIRRDITGFDEVLVVYEGWGSGSPKSSQGFCGHGINFARIRGSQGGEISAAQSVDCITDNFDFSYWSFRNNFDGTWSSIQYAGVGDLHKSIDDDTISGNVYLEVGAIAGGDHQGNSGSAGITIYNTVIKESGFAVCKADEFWQDTNQDSKIQSDECFDLSTIFLRHESSVEQSREEWYAETEAWLKQKQDYLEQQNIVLQEQVDSLEASGLTSVTLEQELDLLRQELSETKQRLADVEARDPNVVAVIEADEPFVESNFITQFFNRVTSFFKNIFEIIGNLFKFGT